MSNETIDFKYEFYKYISNSKFNYKHNLSISEINSLYFFVKNKPFKIVECDKNVGVCFMSHEYYDFLCMKQLSDSNTYNSLNADPLYTINNEMKHILDNLLINKSISKKIYDKLFVKENKLGSFRILAKVHKEKFGVRPIINCLKHPTSNISLLLDLILQPFVKNSKSFILDSQNLIQKTENLYFPSDSKLYSCDFESLYTNINLSQALNVICDFISKNFHSNEINILGFRKLLELVFNYNYFKYNNKYFKQIQGIAMGSICAPSIANLFLSILEELFLLNHKPLFYKRFIDDIFLIVSRFFNINTLKSFFGNLKLNIVSSDVVIFLDLLIRLNRLTNKLNFSVHLKPTNTFSYVLPTSNHPPFIFKNIPISVFFRIARICTYKSDFYKFCRIFYFQFIKKGYLPNNVKKAIRLIGNLDRESILPYKTKNNKYDNIKTLFFQLPFNFNYINVEKFFNNFITNSNLSPINYFKNVNLKLIYKMNSNLSKLLIHNFKIEKPISFNYLKCKKKSCKICFYADTNSYLKLNNFYLPIMSNSNCNSKNLVYILYCNKCFQYYIGKTFSLRKRINCHKRNILIDKFNKRSSIYNSYYYSESSSSSSSSESEHNDFNESFVDDSINLYNHFNLNNHSLRENLKFFVFKNNITDQYDLLNTETQLIHLFLKLGINVLNVRIPNLYKYKRHINLFEQIFI
jgi:predicted GIY-YIG superfamily endonuclease